MVIWQYQNDPEPLTLDKKNLATKEDAFPAGTYSGLLELTNENEDLEETELAR
jgi:hypothetical protein